MPTVEGRVASDFDGTVTDIEAEAKGFVSPFQEGVAKALGLNLYDYKTFTKEATRVIYADSGNFGWQHDGVIVAPATSDPYILERAKAKLVISKLQREKFLPQDQTLDDILDRLFFAAYKKTGTKFRPHAQEYIKILRDKHGGVIITNSGTSDVEKKLSSLLGADHGVRIVGDAKKYVVDVTQLSRVHQPPGFPRPVYVARPHYSKVLRDLGNVQTVVGDIYELDLALPETLGKEVILLTSKRTPPWEKIHFERHPNGFAARSLGDVIAHLDK